MDAIGKVPARINQSIFLKLQRALVANWIAVKT
jgi:hypothetical protein